MKQQKPSRQNQGCLASLLHLLGIKPSAQPSDDSNVEFSSADPEPLPYRLRDDFLSPAEKSFYQVIKGMMGNYFTICPKVSLADIFFVVRPNENKSAYNRINRKHVDFVICEPQSMTPLFAIELDDSSHNRPDRVERDAFVDSVFEAADLPLLHIPVRSGYNTSELGVLFKNTLQKKNALPGSPAEALKQEPARDEEADSPVPTCPKCGTPMVLRMAKNGSQSGRKFYGCANYPKCRVVLPFDDAEKA